MSAALLQSLLSVYPDLKTVDDVLPEDIAARAYRRQRVQICVCDPYREGCVFLSQCLTGLEGAVEVMTDKTSDGKLYYTDYKSEEGDGEEECHCCVCIADMFYGGAGDDHQRYAPEVVAQVFDAYYPPMKPVHCVLYDVCEEHRQEEYEAYLAEDLQEGGEEGDVGTLVDHREAYGDEQRRDEIGQEGICRHIFQTAAEFGCDHRSRRGTRTDNAGEKRLHKYQTIVFHIETEYQAHDDEREDDLEQSHPKVPFHRKEFLEVYLTKGDEKDEKHEQREYRVEDRTEEFRRTGKEWYEGENQIQHRTGEHRCGQCPVLDEIDKFVALFVHIP